MTQIADGEITCLRAELAKVTWQHNEARADLAASRAGERLSSMIDHQRDEAMEWSACCAPNLPTVSRSASGCAKR